jgi:hypothetical protein
MPDFRRFLSRRWLVGISVVLLFGLAMLHPYPRQSLFGPKIKGEPWWVWEYKIRRALAPRHSFFDAMAINIGLVDIRDLEIPKLPDDREMLPFYLHLANDSDAMVRGFSLSRLERCVQIDELRKLPAEDETKVMILTVVRQRLQDDLPSLQIIAADYAWRITGDREMIKVPLAHINVWDGQFRDQARIAFCQMAAADPEVSFGPISQWARFRGEVCV